ncbi:putative manganese-dependent inorganic diphosphatase [Inediibacterium massiliense]|uniref:putative manganese-dependent inorganic diphosphatase n=1 Tax=Inediibacterium massiliense TaxID=1658111 RepID=UPI0006B6606F|nr:putative manganese-dependent inorganic diphosphatase [Inediibacterium massiliense]
MKTLIFGHQNPDTDSVCSAIAYSYLKNQMGESTVPKVLGTIQKESLYVLDKFNVNHPDFLENVKIQVKDLEYTQVSPIQQHHSILHAYHHMESNQLKTIPIVDENRFLKGLLTMKDIAMEMIHGDFRHIKTSLSNIINDLDGIPLYIPDEDKLVEGNVSVMAYYYKSIVGLLGSKDIIIVGDRYDIIEMAISNKVQLLIITGECEIPQKYIDLAQKNSVPIIKIPKDTYTVSKLFQQCNFVCKIMKKSSLVKFSLDDYIDDIKDDIITTNFRNYPILDANRKFMGFIGRKHLLNPQKKQVILVDHNEFSQSAEGIDDAQILEIIDHHKIGGISTNLPINFMNIPIGSTCTIIYELYKSNHISIPCSMAGLMLSGIISDTLYFKSPTCTQRDIHAVEELNKITQLNLDEYALSMFKAGTALEGYTEEEIFFRDFKDFLIHDMKIGISQVFTLDIEEVNKKQSILIKFMDQLRQQKEYHMLILTVTDIINEGSYFFYSSSNENLLSYAFHIDPIQGAFAKDIVSRKKQIVPMLTHAIELLNYI